MVKQRIDWSQDGCELSQANKQINQFWRLSLIRSCRCCDTVMWISWYMWHFEPLASNHTAGCIDVNTAGIRAVPESGRIRDGTPIYVKLLICRPVSKASCLAETPQIHIKYEGFLWNCPELPGFHQKQGFLNSIILICVLVEHFALLSCWSATQICLFSSSGLLNLLISAP